MCLTKYSVLYSSVVIRRIFYFSLVLAIVAITGFSICILDVNSLLTLFRIEKISRGWSFWSLSITRTSLLSYSSFFFPLVEVGLVELVVLLATLLVGGTEEVGGREVEVEVEEEEEEEEKENDEDGGANVDEERPFFSFSA